MNKQEVVIKIGGAAGFGIKVSGLILGKTLFNNGLYVFGYSEYPSLIRDGHNVYQLKIAKHPVTSATKKIDILVALNQETVDLHKDKLNKGGVIIYDGLKLQEDDFKNINLIDIALVKLAEEAGGVITKNIVALGAVMAVLGLDLDLFNKEIEREFKDKGDKIIAMDKKAAKFGYETTNKYLNSKSLEQNLKIKDWQLIKRNDKNSFILTANEATAYGMIQAGCGFYSAYPMTPATSIMHVLAVKQRKFGLVVHQTEDEISAIGAAIGAATTGVRSATGSSGGGFSLMVENVGFAGVAEIPLVIIEAQRTSPASGMPTWTEQGDLKFVLSASHGEFPRIVLAPGDAEEAFYMMQQAFNYAERFQVPVIFLLDKFLSESDFILENIDINKIKINRGELLTESELIRKQDYKRYEITENGISKRALVGQKGGVHIVNSDEHDEKSYSTEQAEMRQAMMDKRFNKVKTILAELPEPQLYGDKNAELTLVGWGSVKGVVLDAISELKLNNNELKINFLHLASLWPFPARRTKAVLENAKNILLVENNKTGQLGDLIRQETSIEIKNKFLKYDGRPFFREEIIKAIKKYL